MWGSKVHRLVISSPPLVPVGISMAFPFVIDHERGERPRVAPPCCISAGYFVVQAQHELSNYNRHENRESTSRQFVNATLTSLNLVSPSSPACSGA